jgi:hypothetical protein
LFAKEMNGCSQDRFGAACEHRFTKSREYLPHFRDLIAPGVDAAAMRRRRTCAGAWFQQWLCSLPPAPQDLTGITVGKTVLERVVKGYAATLDRRKVPRRATFDLDRLRRWPWRPANLAPLPVAARACCHGGVDWGGEQDEAWLMADACPRELAQNRWPQAATAAAGAGAASGGGSGGGGALTLASKQDQQAFAAAGEEVLRGAVHASGSSDAWGGGYSSGAVWWAGQLAAHSLASFGKCGVLAAQSLQRIGGGSEEETGSARGAGPKKARQGSRRGGGGGGGGVAELRVAMHVRRGDSCMRWAKHRGDASLRGGRPCFPTSMYVDAAEQVLAAYGGGKSGGGKGQAVTGVLHLATDSAQAAEGVATSLRAEGWRVVTLLYDRGAVGGSDGANAGKQVDRGTVYIEDRLKEHDPTLDQELVIGSLLAELELLSGADALVGTSSSWVTRLAFLLMVGRRGTPPPFVFLDAPFGCLNIKPCPVK